MLVIGLMSGTSLDGVDASLVNITKEKNSYKYEQVGFIFVPYKQELKNKIPAHLGFNISRNYMTWGEINTSFETWEDMYTELPTWEDVYLFVQS
jgi:1,6-anhydro-N-acetylmuramate kinase